MQQYTVSKGDTLQRIASRRGLILDNIVNANPWSAQQPYLIPGQILFLPSSPRRRYEIQTGDSIESVSAAFSVSEEGLEQLNPGISRDRFPVGRTLVLPASESKYVVEPQGEYGYHDMLKDIQYLTSTYSCIKTTSIGESVLGKSLIMLQIGRGKRKIHVNAALHANEWITTPTLLRFIEEYMSAYQKRERWNGYDPVVGLEECTLWLLPMANPDGVELVQEGITDKHPYYTQLLEWNNQRYDFKHWKANIQGIDLGDQFPAHWEEEVNRRGKQRPSPRDYPGISPLSEPEAIALADFTLQISPDAVISLHSQGQEIYWNYRNHEPEESESWSRRLSQVSGYRAVKLTGSDAGYKDWFIQQFGRPGFTVEVGLGMNPLPLKDFHNISVEIGMIVAEMMTF
ncbi:M14 family zinc carboxypeptidase [Paenibacillus sp. DS2015]|uniref:M14 family zinc carboxypeptidase n=1 Tax=Paenibacillus sp. DS2015 TaxID=3373917 RepID=UPI003D1FFFBA